MHKKSADVFLSLRTFIIFCIKIPEMPVLLFDA